MEEYSSLYAGGMADTRQHRRELLETVETQKETISKYETRLRDLVRAYKGLAKEKEALEATLKAISEDANEGEGAEEDGEDEEEAQEEEGDGEEKQEGEEQQKGVCVSLC